MLRLDHCLYIVNRVRKQPRANSRDPSCQKCSHDRSFGRIIAFWGKNPHAVLINSEIFAQSNNLSQKSNIESKKDSTDPVLLVDLDSAVNGTMVPLVGFFLDLHLYFEVIDWGLNIRNVTMTRALGMPVKNPERNRSSMVRTAFY